MSKPAFASVPLPPSLAQLTVANANRDGTGTTVQVVAGPAAGARAADVIEEIVIKAPATTTAGQVRFFLSVDGGATKRLIHEQPVLPAIPSGTASAFRAVVPELAGLVLASDQVALYAATHNAETLNVIVQKAGIPA